MHSVHETAASHEEIAYRAYEIYLENGFHDGNDLADWFAAERQLTGYEGRKTVNPSASKTANLWRHATA
jgi:hypothetical protein